jgi:co-chaperonin GroES (HSP10)
MTAKIASETKLLPRRGWVLVLSDARKTKLESGIFLPGSETKAEKVTEQAGLVIRLGPHDHLDKIGVVEGDRIVYRGFMKHHVPIETGECWPDGSTKEFFLMDVKDILAVVPEGIEVGIYTSRPSQHAVESVDAEGNVKMRS